MVQSTSIYSLQDLVMDPVKISADVGTAESTIFNSTLRHFNAVQHALKVSTASEHLVLNP
jgi:hypothetical protein